MSTSLIAPKSTALAGPGVNIHVPSVPGRLKITQTMVEDFIVDPVLGASILFKVKLDEFQKARLKTCWWTPRVMDSSGYSSAKTFNMWMVSNLRCILIPGHVSGVYYPSHPTGKVVYWPYFNKVAARSELFRAQVGAMRVMGVDGKSEEMAKASKMDSSCFTFQYRNDSMVMMPAGNFLQGSKTQAGIRFHDLNIDEWQKIEAMPTQEGVNGIDDQLIGRATMEEFNQDHPFWCNHHLFIGTAQDTMHPSHERYKTYQREVKKGNPDYFLISYSFKDWSDRSYVGKKTFRHALRNEKNLRDMRNNKSAAGYRQEGLGIWSNNGKGWYTPEIISRCYEIGIERNAPVLCGHNEERFGSDEQKRRVHFFLGADPAKADDKKADDGALVALRVEPIVDNPGNEMRNYRLDFTWAYKVRGADAPEWAGIIHRKHRHFRFTGIMMDPGGGGNWIRPELAKVKQSIGGEECKVKPIACIEDEADLPATGEFILSMFKITDQTVNALWGHMAMKTPDNLNDTAHSEFLEALRAGIIGFPMPFDRRPKEEVDLWPEEKRWANILIDKMAEQLTEISVQTKDDGSTFYTRNLARVFTSKKRKDFAYAGLYAFTRFLTWLKTADDDIGAAEEDADMCG